MILYHILLGDCKLLQKASNNKGIVQTQFGEKYLINLSDTDY